jgi:hypothetical protein
VRQGALTNLCPTLLLRIRQDLYRLVHQSIGRVERRLQHRRPLQAFGAQILQRLSSCWESFFPWTWAMESLTWVMRSMCNITSSRVSLHEIDHFSF